MTDIELVIIKAMAMGYLSEDDCGFECLHCHTSATKPRTDVELKEEIYHTQDCPVILARQLLRDTGMPMNIYKVTGMDHYMTSKLGKHWKNFTEHTLAISEVEALKDYNCFNGVKDVHVEFVREMPIDFPVNAASA